MRACGLAVFGKRSADEMGEMAVSVEDEAVREPIGKMGVLISLGTLWDKAFPAKRSGPVLNAERIAGTLDRVARLKQALRFSVMKLRRDRRKPAFRRFFQQRTDTISGSGRVECERSFDIPPGNPRENSPQSRDPVTEIVFYMCDQPYPEG